MAPGLRQAAKDSDAAHLTEHIQRIEASVETDPALAIGSAKELLETCCDRVATGLERLLRKHPEGRIAVVVPEPLERIIRWIVAAEPLGDLWERHREGPGVVVLPLAAQWAVPMRERVRAALSG
jgi:hypothetical protein